MNYCTLQYKILFMATGIRCVLSIRSMGWEDSGEGIFWFRDVYSFAVCFLLAGS